MLKNELLTLLESARGSYINGEELAKKLSVTRSAVWKAIKFLREDGYVILAATNRGYMLSGCNDILSAQSITPYLTGAAVNFRFDIRKSLPSTNSELKKLAANGEQAGLVLIANEQTAGRGRMGRSFYSPADNGIYMSVLLRPELPSDKAMLLTCLAAVSVAKAIEQAADVKIGIKWVNDLYIGEKKVVGILTEGGIDLESRTLQYAVVGIGVNVSTENFPNELKSTAASVSKIKKSRLSRSKLTALILNQLADDLPKLKSKEFIAEYKARSILIGRKINVLKNGMQIPAVALDIDDNASLIVRYDNGIIEALSSNDVSIRI